TFEFNAYSSWLVVGSINGLLSLIDMNINTSPLNRDSRLCFWNPATRAKTEDFLASSTNYFQFAFGYDALNETYKVVVFHVESDVDVKHENGDTLILANDVYDEAFIYNCIDNRVTKIEINDNILWSQSKIYIESFLSTHLKINNNNIEATTKRDCDEEVEIKSTSSRRFCHLRLRRMRVGDQKIRQTPLDIHYCSSPKPSRDPLNSRQHLQPSIIIIFKLQLFF
ncbi:hypothetical protein RYX36_028810, partial [Vicia faba]